MKTIVLMAKNHELLRGSEEYLKQFFRVQACAEGASHALNTIKVLAPDLAVIHLVGYTHEDQNVFAQLQTLFPNLPVLTVGAANERLQFAPYYRGRQFENVSRPIEQPVLFSAVCRRLGLDEQAVRDEAAAAANSGRKVLVVDDNAATLRSIKGMLETRYSVTLANSGTKALTSIVKSRPDVILLDYEMPVCDGRQTLEMIRADEEMSDIPVIFLTSVNDKEHIEAVIKLYPAGYLLKPAVPERLIESIEKALNGAKA